MSGFRQMVPGTVNIIQNGQWAGTVHTVTGGVPGVLIEHWVLFPNYTEPVSGVQAKLLDCSDTEHYPAGFNSLSDFFQAMQDHQTQVPGPYRYVEAVCTYSNTIPTP